MAYTINFRRGYYSKAALKQAIRRMQYVSGGTSTSSALSMLKNTGFKKYNGDRPKVHNIAILITDGVPNNVRRTISAAKQCKKIGIEFFIVAAQAPRYAVASLKAIAHTTHSHYYVLPKFLGMQKQAANIGRQVCTTVNSYIKTSRKKTCKQNIPADIYFMIDSSGSVTSQNFPFLLQFVTKIIDSLPLGQNTTRVGVYRYEHRIDLVIPLDKHYSKTKLKQAVMKIKYSKGMTFTDQVLKQMRTRGFTAKNGARKGVVDIGVLITDGISTFRKKTLQETRLCKQAGIQLFAIGVAVPNSVEIQQIGSKLKKDHVFTIKHFPDLLHKARDIHHKLCENINKANKPCKSNLQVDLYFILDGSENLQKANFPKALAFINSIIGSLPVGQNGVRVGFMMFDFVAKMVFPLDKYFTIAKLQAAVNRAKFIGGGCSIFDALKAIRTVAFTSKHGDRPGVHNMAVLISSGVPYGFQQALTEAAATKKAGVELFVVGVAGASAMTQLNQLASTPVKAHVFRVDKASKLSAKTLAYSKLICKTVNKHPVKSMCKKNHRVDLYFIVDGSENIQKVNFPKALAFVNSIIGSLHVGQRSVRVGLIVYNAAASLVVPLNKYNKASQLKAAVNKVKFVGGGCNLSDAFKVVQNVGFTSKNGDRAGIHNMAIVISSGLPYGFKQALTEATATMKSGVELFVVGVGVKSMTQLNQFASKPVKGHVFSVDKASKLSANTFVYSKLICKTVNKYPTQ